ncbi:DUF2550 domain-containing protein [Corynebacterium crudilactis]|uniref:DUF2550 domain-containing protein n=1 Tax=Corynebacterium crudilactis TaxID=1652495 RepID=A0A172QSV4_9CORY|nr:DUF2550 domain-containing protein [Corynebacterium crudilactis]ANE03783.1 hypothetical protein ccrud_05855 [Corynebacterium crudilactis]
MEFITWAVVVVAVLAVILLAAWRFFTLRSKGTSVILRELPQNGVHGWRHGLFRYNGNKLEYFKLRSLLPMSNLTLDRLSVTLLDRRDPVSDEAVFMSKGVKVLHIQSNDDHIEIALNTHSEMAFTAWLEAAPDARAEHTLNARDFNRFRPGKDTRKNR